MNFWHILELGGLHRFFGATPINVCVLVASVNVCSNASFCVLFWMPLLLQFRNYFMLSNLLLDNCQSSEAENVVTVNFIPTSEAYSISDWCLSVWMDGWTDGWMDGCGHLGYLCVVKLFFQIATLLTVFLRFSRNLAHVIYLPMCKNFWRTFAILHLYTLVAPAVVLFKPTGSL